MTTAPITRYAVNGTNDDEHVCAKCGRIELRRVVWLTPLDHDGNSCGIAQPYGTTCAARLLAPSSGHSMVAAALVKIADATTYARKWIEKGATLESIRSAVTTRFGVPADVIDDRLVLYTVAGTVTI